MDVDKVGLPLPGRLRLNGWRRQRECPRTRASLAHGAVALLRECPRRAAGTETRPLSRAECKRAGGFSSILAPCAWPGINRFAFKPRGAFDQPPSSSRSSRSMALRVQALFKGGAKAPAKKAAKSAPKVRARRLGTREARWISRPVGGLRPS